MNFFFYYYVHLVNTIKFLMGSLCMSITPLNSFSSPYPSHLSLLHLPLGPPFSFAKILFPYFLFNSFFFIPFLSSLILPFNHLLFPFPPRKRSTFSYLSFILFLYFLYRRNHAIVKLVYLTYCTYDYGFKVHPFTYPFLWKNITTFCINTTFLLSIHLSMGI